MGASWKKGDPSPSTHSHLLATFIWELSFNAGSWRQDEKYWHPLGSPLGEEGALCPWLYQSGMEFLPPWAGRSKGKTGPTSNTIESHFSLKSLVDFLEYSFFICSMPPEPFPETLNGCSFTIFTCFTVDQIRGVPQAVMLQVFFLILSLYWL